ncbi:NPD-domain-containing protein [Gonapodya prolifera JEL478]|uniref:NPD-domain-containing protein n=1 Tax=Gonapodya prolifera (strain JEL478) TaxID=1344416 RepID=A0A139AY86_GONPJ|nr:NPD-domain-containing protein [Gonapodya prolifera JEL478]|eukprot:KXS21680.1 NPD-domain-containing protein [Gonapodya prolifera JEL478]
MAFPPETINTPLTKLFGIKYPILLAGMAMAAGPELAAAVSNAGGLGVIGGLGYTPEQMKKLIKTLKENLTDKSLPFGIDLALPQVGGNARKTNYDYTKGKLPELIDLCISEGAKLFVSAVGVPPKWAIDKLHKAGIPVMNMVGAPKHAIKAIEQGVDIICAQGGEGGGHTGDIPTSILIPKIVDVCSRYRSSLTGEPIHVVAAGGIYEGRSLAMSLCMGAQAVWVGTRFVACKEAGASNVHKEAVVTAGFDDTIRTLIFSGRPLRTRKTPYVMNWENNRQAEIQELVAKGVLPVYHDLAELEKKGEAMSTEVILGTRPLLMGQVAANIDDIPSAKEIVDDMVTKAVKTLKEVSGRIGATPRL